VKAVISSIGSGVKSKRERVNRWKRGERGDVWGGQKTCTIYNNRLARVASVGHFLHVVFPALLQPRFVVLLLCTC